MKQWSRKLSLPSAARASARRTFALASPLRPTRALSPGTPSRRRHRCAAVGSEVRALKHVSRTKGAWKQISKSRRLKFQKQFCKIGSELQPKSKFNFIVVGSAGVFGHLRARHASHRRSSARRDQVQRDQFQRGLSLVSAQDFQENEPSRTS